ncbi:ciliary-associated calcium-binding coiled-coil protein 1 isoform X1 [Biomphalaria glabrata]|nr:ciliary-associated calcium-binding coiled-coil protein 1 isoform X1 [Biomphalaria glabrata]
MSKSKTKLHSKLKEGKDAEYFFIVLFIASKRLRVVDPNKMQKGKAKPSRSPQAYSEDTPLSERKHSFSDKKISHGYLNFLATNQNLSITDNDHSKKTEFPFLILTQVKCEELIKMTVNEIESELAIFFKLQPATDLKDAAILDYYVGAAYWAKEQGYNVKQFAGFFSICYQLLHKIQEEHCSMVDLFKTYHHKLAGIGTEDKLGDLDFFNIEQAKHITDYLQSSIFQHFKLYDFLFTKPQMEEIMSCNLTLEVPLPAKTPYPPPLDEALSESVYKDYLVLPLSSSSDKVEDSVTSSSLLFDVSLPEDVEDLFAKLTLEDVKTIIQEVTTEVIQNLQTSLDNKIKAQEANVLAKINKIKVIPLEEPAAPSNV